MDQTAEYLGQAHEALDRALPACRPLGALTDGALTGVVTQAEELSRHLDVVKVRLAAEIARRSSRQLGHSGLASRQGYQSPEAMLRGLTRTSFQDRARRIRVGAVLAAYEAGRLGPNPDGKPDGEPGDQPNADGESSTAADPLRAVAAGVLESALGLDAADQAVRALSPILGQVHPDTMQQATLTLVGEAPELNADEVGVAARGLRDSLNRAGVADRQAHLRAQRSLRKGRIVDGLRRVTLVLDPESDAILVGAISAAMSPRLGGPRFTAEPDQTRAARLRDDERSNEQIALDTLIDLVRIGVDRDDGTILGSSKPAVRVTIPLADLLAAVDTHGHEHPEGDTGTGWLEGSTEPVTAAAARRYLCDAGALPIVLGGASEPLDLGRTRRLFTAAQRVALANRDGGCRWPGCDRPASWAEAHHINPFGADGKTDLADGILLCRNDHMNLHNNGWHIERGGSPGDFHLIPPKSIDPEQKPRPMPTKLPPWLNSG